MELNFKENFLLLREISLDWKDDWIEINEIYECYRQFETNLISTFKIWKIPCCTAITLGRRFAAALLPRLFGTNPMSHHKGGFEPETNGFQFYAIANLDKTSL